MPPAVTTQEQAMAEMQDFAEEIGRKLLDQLKIDHAEAAAKNDAFRREIGERVNQIQVSVAVLTNRTDGLEKSVGAVNAGQREHEGEHKGITAKIIGLMIAVMGAMGAALLSLWHGGSR